VAVQQELARRLDDAALTGIFGHDVFMRGASYASEGRVVDMAFDADERTMVGLIEGSGGKEYVTTVTLDPDDLFGGTDLEAYCTCPMGMDCKHAVALLIAHRHRADAAGLASRRPAAWERALAQVVEAADAESTAIPMGLQFEVTTRQARPTPYSRIRPSTIPQRRVRLRPVVPGTTGAWVRTGVTWRHLYVVYDGAPYVAEQQLALHELLMAHSTRGAGYGSYGDTMHLDDFGSSLWRLLRQLVDCGVQLVSAGKSGAPVTLSASPASVSFDLSLDDPQQDATMVPRLRLGDQMLDLATLDFLGTPAHGVCVHAAGGLVLAPLDHPLDGGVDSLVRGGEPVQIPPPDLDRFLIDYYPRLRRAVPVTSTDGSVPLPEIAPPRLSLTVTYSGGHRIGLEWGFEYRVGDTVRTCPLTPTESNGVRDPAAERHLLHELQLPDRLPQLRAGVDGARRLLSPVILTGIDAVVFLDEVLPGLRDDPTVVVHEHGEPPDFRAADNPPEVRLRTTDAPDETDWFDLHVSVWVDGEEVPFDILFTALVRGDSHLLLPTGTWFSLDHDELHNLRRLIEEARSLLDHDDGPLRISRYQAGFWDELQSLGIVEEQSKRWADVVQALVDVDQVDPPAVPAALQATLRPYQVEGYQWLSGLWAHRLGGILADDMGLGKTVQTLALLCQAKDAGQLLAPALVVAPTSVVRNWVTEAEHFAPGLRVRAIAETEAKSGVPMAGQATDVDLVVTTYALFRIDYECYAALPWSALVLDEAQFVKNHQAKTYQCARRLPAAFKLAITGTPLENNLMELWALLSIVAPGLFPSPQRFSEFYRKPIERGSDTSLLASLRRRIRPLMRRRTKEEVATELPAKQEQVLEVDLTPRHRKVYDTHLQRERQKILGLVHDLDRNRFTILKSLTMLRQLSLDAALVDGTYAAVKSAKVEVLLGHLTELAAEGHRALVFSQFTGFLGRVRDRLDEEGIAYCYLDGSTRNRDRVIAGFKEGDAAVFLISLKAGGFGLNLTEADYCFILDPWWNPATEAQAVDRTHRIGQDKSVVVYRLVSTDTIEEKVMALKARKAELFSSVMGDDGTLAGPLTADDIKALLEH
jgi:superfamily II DNA or RNA helicase